MPTIAHIAPEVLAQVETIATELRRAETLAIYDESQDLFTIKLTPEELDEAEESDDYYYPSIN